MKLLAVSVGRIALLAPNARLGSHEVSSAIAKSPASTLDSPQPVGVGFQGVDGDEQADRTRHGGRDRAVYAYPAEHYAVWRTIRMQALQIDADLAFGSMGENLTLSGLTEDRVWIGDVITVGSNPEEAPVFRVSAPREPCYKLNVRLGFRHAAAMMQQSAYTGFYLQVLKTGIIRAGDPVSVAPGARIMRVDEQHRYQTDCARS